MLLTLLFNMMINFQDIIFILGILLAISLIWPDKKDS